MKSVLYFIPNLNRSYGGVYQYSLSLLKALIKEQNPVFYFYVLCSEPGDDILSLTDEYKNLKIVDLVKESEPFFSRLKRISFEIGNLISKRLWNKEVFVVESCYQYIINKYKINITHCPYQKLLKVPGVPAISTLHDVQELYFPQFFTPIQRIERAISFERLAQCSDAIIVSYHHVKKDVIKFFQVPAHKIHVCFLALKDLWLDSYTETDILDLQELSLPEEFIFYPAATWEHKNHIRLLESLKLLKDEGIMIHAVFTGHKTEFYNKIEEKILQWNLAEQVYFIGLVDDVVLYSIYKKAKAVVVTSLYEAGSFPLMESMILNVPVICSNVTSLPETIGNPMFTFDPNNATEIAEKIESIFFDQSFRTINKKNNEEKSQILRNSCVAQKIFSLYNSFA